MEIKEFGTNWGSDAYFQAVTEGLIEPSMSLEDFSSRSEHQVIQPSEKEQDRYCFEVMKAARNVYHLFDPKFRSRILREYYGSSNYR